MLHAPLVGSTLPYIDGQPIAKSAIFEIAIGHRAREKSMKIVLIAVGLAISVSGYILLLPKPDTASRFAMAGSEAYVRAVILYVV